MISSRHSLHKSCLTSAFIVPITFFSRLQLRPREITLCFVDLSHTVTVVFRRKADHKKLAWLTPPQRFTTAITTGTSSVNSIGFPNENYLGRQVSPFRTIRQTAACSSLPTAVEIVSQMCRFMIDSRFLTDIQAG